MVDFSNEWAPPVEYEQPTQPAKRGKVQFLSIPNNPLGWVFLRMLKHWANRETYKIVVRGRTPRGYVKHWNELWRRCTLGTSRAPRFVRTWVISKGPISTQWSVPVKHGKRLGVYFKTR